MGLPQWTAYQRALEALFDSQAERLATGLNHDEYLFQCGVICALRVVAALPQSLTQAEQRTYARPDTDGTDPDRGLLNTPWYLDWRRSADYPRRKPGE